MPPNYTLDAVEVGIEGNDLRDSLASYDPEADRIRNGQFSPEGHPAVYRGLKEVGVGVPNLAGIAEIVKELQPFTHPDPAPNLRHGLRDDEIRHNRAPSDRPGNPTGVAMPSVPPVRSRDEETGVGESHFPPLCTRRFAWTASPAYSTIPRMSRRDIRFRRTTRISRPTSSQTSSSPGSMPRFFRMGAGTTT